MRKLIPVFMMSAAVIFVGGCKTSQKRDVAAAPADIHSILDYNYKLTDVKTAGVTKEQLFAELDPQNVILNSSSICSNRALIWGWNMKRAHNIDSGKIFVFYSKGFFNDAEYHGNTGGAVEDGDATEKQWWYHVAPYVVDGDQEYVLDHGFSANVARENRKTPAETLTKGWKGPITRPLSINEWLLRFPKTTKCKEITAKDVKLTDYMRRGQAFPHPSEGGEARCYFRKVPMTYWTPLSVAMHELGKTGSGEALYQPFDRDNFWEGDILTACEEAVSEDGVSRMFGRGAKMETCLRYTGLDKSVPGYAALTPLQPFDKKLAKRKAKGLRRLQSF